MTKKPAIAPAAREKSPKAEAIGARIKASRINLGYTQAQLSSILNVTENAVTQWETGRAVPGMDRIEALLPILKVSREWLLTGMEPGELTRAQTKTEERLLRLIRTIPLEDQEIALAALQGISASFTKK